MPCFHPLPAARVSGGGVSLKGAPKERLGLGLQDWLFLPCGSCVGCLKSRAREWAIRCSLELQFHAEACWATLTYSDQYVPPTLSKRHLQLFVKRLRSRLPGARLRFFASGEYGERTFRPHYHPILYGVSRETLRKEAVRDPPVWPYGKVMDHQLRPEGIAYVAGYVAKKIGFTDDAEERIDYATGEVYQYQPPFIQMSRRPGIGGDARQWWRSWRDHAHYNGKAVPVPRFLHQEWKSHADFMEVVELEVERRQQRKELDYDRLAAGEQIAQAGLNLQAERRQL